MEVKAQLNKLRISPRKMRLVANFVKGMSVGKARIQLEFSNKKSSNPMLKLLNSAVANAKNNFKLEENNLYISELLVNVGPTLKRWHPRAMGRAFPINKRTCDVALTLNEMDKIGKKEGKKSNKKVLEEKMADKEKPSEKKIHEKEVEKSDDGKKKAVKNEKKIKKADSEKKR